MEISHAGTFMGVTALLDDGGEENGEGTERNVTAEEHCLSRKD